MIYFTDLIELIIKMSLDYLTVITSNTLHHHIGKTSFFMSL